MLISFMWSKALNMILPGNCLHLQKNQALFHDYSFLVLKAHLPNIWYACVCACTSHLETLRFLQKGRFQCFSLQGVLHLTHLEKLHSASNRAFLSSCHWNCKPAKQRGIQRSKTHHWLRYCLGELSCTAQVQFYPYHCRQGKRTM